MPFTWQAIELVERLRASLKQLNRSSRGERVVLEERVQHCIRVLNEWSRKPPPSAEQQAFIADVESLCAAMIRSQRKT